MSSYIINRTDGGRVTTLSSAMLDVTSTALILPGRDYVNYGEIMVENVVHMMENFSNATPPPNPLEGQMWFDSGSASQTKNRLHVYTNETWVPLATIRVGDFTNQSTVRHEAHGELFYNPATGQLYTPDTSGGSPGSSKLTLIGPLSPRDKDTQIRRLVINGTAEALGMISGGRLHSLYYSGTAIATVSSIADGDKTYPAAGFQFTGQTDLEPGLTFSKTSDSGRLFSDDHHPQEHTTNDLGTATRRWRQTHTRDLYVANAYIDSIITAGVTVSMADFIRRDNGAGAAASRNPSVYPLDFGTATSRWGSFFSEYVDTHFVVPSTTGGMLGQSGRRWAEIHVDAFVGGGQFKNGGWGLNNASVHATYADVAERYAADELLEPGTVVRLGGEREVTRTTRSYDDEVLGVVSTSPAILLNSGLTDQPTCPPIALAGRVPCRVTGRVRKGQRLVSSDLPGIAMGLNGPVASHLAAIIGRSLIDKDDDGIGAVEMVVGVK